MSKIKQVYQDLANEGITRDEAIELIVALCEHLEWNLAINNSDPEAEVNGMIIGNDQFINEILDTDEQDFDHLDVEEN